MQTSTTEQRKLKVQRRLTWFKCQESFLFFFLHFWVVQMEDGRKVVEARPLQIECADLIQTTKRCIFLKARQIGWTELIKAYLFWKSFFHDDMHCMILSKKLDPDALLVIQAIKFSYGNLHAWMRAMGPKMLNDAKGSIEWSNGSYIHSDATKDSPARGRTLNLLVMDEFGKFPNPDDAWGSALPATEHGQLIVLGNANGYGTRFWKLCQQSKAGLNDFTYKFYPWNAVPGRTEQWRIDTTSSMSNAEKAAEYPYEDEECWIQAGDPVYDVDRIKEWERTPGKVTEWEGGVGYLTTWALPQQGKKYVVGADVAFGGEFGDYSVAQIIDIETGQHVAKWKGKLERHQFSEVLNVLGLRYNRAVVAVEINGPGQTVVDALRMDYHYPNLYSRRVYNQSQQTEVTKFGWYTDKKTKWIIIDGLFNSIDNGDIEAKDEALFLEMATYRYLSNGDMGGLPHDDEVMSMAIAVRAWNEQPRAGIKQEKKKDPSENRWAKHDGTLMGAAFAMNSTDFEQAKAKLAEYLKEPEPETRFVMNGGNT